MSRLSRKSCYPKKPPRRHMNRSIVGGIFSKYCKLGPKSILALNIAGFLGTSIVEFPFSISISLSGCIPILSSFYLLFLSSCSLSSSLISLLDPNISSLSLPVAGFRDSLWFKYSDRILNRIILDTRHKRANDETSRKSHMNNNRGQSSASPQQSTSSNRGRSFTDPKAFLKTIDTAATPLHDA